MNKTELGYSKICSKILENKITRNICFKENTTVSLIMELIRQGKGKFVRTVFTV